MKFIKKILRLLPILLILSCLISCVVYSIVLRPNDFGPLYYFNLEDGLWDNIDNSIMFIINGNSYIMNLFTWITNNISNSYLVTWSFCVMCYELFLSLIFLMFDIINMVFNWANKWINKGVKID